MSVVVVAEVAALAGAILSVDVPASKVVFLLPFVWLLLESAKRAQTRRPTSERLGRVRPWRARRRRRVARSA